MSTMVAPKRNSARPGVIRENFNVSAAAPTCPPPIARSSSKSPFYPRAVETFEEAGLNPAMTEGLVLKFILSIGAATGRRIAAELGLPFGPFPDFLRGLKNQQILAYANSASANDYLYTLTDNGRARAKMYMDECAYVGSAPVPFHDYLKSVAAQTITSEHPREEDLREAFSDLLIADETCSPARAGDQLGTRTVPLRVSGQRQDQHRRTHHALLWNHRLDPQGDPGRRPDYQTV